jgi:hypothetical protein
VSEWVFDGHTLPLSHSCNNYRGTAREIARVKPKLNKGMKWAAYREAALCLQYDTPQIYCHSATGIRFGASRYGYPIG